jgi:mono/diheme cytochrome c family protein
MEGWNMRARSFRWVLWVAVGVVVAGCAAGIQLTREQIQDPGQLLFNGHVRPEINCFYCHNGDGKGAGRGPDLSAKLAHMPDAAVLEIIAKGATFMPAFADRLSVEERAQILVWLRASFGGPAAAEAVEAEAVD